LLLDNSRSLNFRAVFQVFQQGVSYEETDRYKRDYKKHGREEAERWKNRLQSLYNSFQKYGYLSQQELPSHIPVAQYKKCPYKKYKEVSVAIDREGRFLRLPESGNRRLALAKVLGIKHIPVFVQGVHYKWALQCYEKHGGDLLRAINKELRSLDVGSG